MSDALLKTRALQSGYGKTIICHDVTLDLAPGEITCIIGPNGAGKSTLLKTIAGVVRPVSGSVTVAGREIAGLPAAQVARSGMAYVREPDHGLLGRQDPHPGGL